MRVDLSDFLRNGKLGVIDLGTPVNLIRALLGKPEDISRQGSRREIWRYGALQLAFDKGSLTFMGVYFQEQLGLPDTIVVEGYFPSHLTTLDQIEGFLNGEDISYRVDSDLTFDAQLCLLVGVGVHICFISNRAVSMSKKYYLDSIQYASTRGTRN